MNSKAAESEIKRIDPENVFVFFKEISKIPRCSGNERHIADYLEDFANRRNLSCYRDAIDNVLIIREASAGYENEESIMLQAHTDMVCEKLPDSPHDFEKDGLELKISDGYIFADGTTLGADDGIGVALMLGVLDDASIKTPRLECLFTVCEETGMDGAKFFDYRQVSARKIINIDSERELEACGGCAGGMRVKLILHTDRAALNGSAFKISIGGLYGGHSGMDIGLGRANAIVLMGRLLNELYKETPFCIISLDGGGRDNVIAPFATAVITVCGVRNPKNYYKKYQDIAREFASETLKKFKKDEHFYVKTQYEKVECGSMMTYKSTSNLISALVLAPYGVMSYMPDQSEFVESSVNIGVLETNEESAEITFLLRAPVEEIMSDTAEKIRHIAKLTGGEVQVVNSYPGWAMEQGTPLQKQYIEACKKIYGSEQAVKVVSVHAGLECGYILDGINMITPDKKADAISIGPNIYDIHTPKERLDIKSVGRLWSIVTEILSKKD